ncbi:hypothetical protein [Levilactobacillus fuyuanensis]|uniref:Uncharacterized protein n=1 Tax=Levilactobacillus fuyuanensis TaxID=2486022 RepID=A0ABW4H0T2_9LACO|nr:hypothetical protein [Levilactobacillus fuyuanensis]
MLEPNDFMRVDITKQKDFAMKEMYRCPAVENSLAATEFLWITYRNVHWEFSQNVKFFHGDVNIPTGWAFQFEHDSRYYQLLGEDTLVTGSLDFNFGELPAVFLSQQEPSIQTQKLIKNWHDCVSRSSSYINVSLTPTIMGGKLPRSPWLPVFLFELNQYYTENSQQFFKQYTNREREMFKLYLDNAFELSTFRGQPNRIVNYCREVLFLEDPWLLGALIDYGERFQRAKNSGHSLLDDIDEVRKLIHLARWYWAEKQANTTFY